jgi:competence protein ComEC
MRVPAALVALPLVAGSAIGLLLDGHVHPGFEFAAAIASVLTVLSVLGWLLDRDDAAVACASVVSALVIGIAVGTTAARSAYHPPLLTWFQSAGGVPAAITIDGRLREDASTGPSGVTIVVDVERARDDRGNEIGAAGGVRLSVAGELAMSSMAAWRAGRRLRATATVREPTVYLDPGVTDERRALLRRGIALVGSVKSGALIEVLGSGSLVDEWAAALRAAARTAIASAIGRWSTRSAGVAAAIVIGDRTGLAADDERRLQEAGTYHVIAISGGNIAILTLLLLGVLRWLRAPPRAAAAVAISLLLFYGRVTGASASVERAISAAVLVLAGRMIDQRGAPLNVLAVAAILAVAAAPIAVFDPGFLLSFGATLAILIGVPRLVPLKPDGRRRSAVRALFAATLSAEIALTPISAALFARVTAAGLVLNFLAIPLMTVIQAGALASLALWPMAPGLSAHVGYVVHLAARALIESAQLVDVVPWLIREVTPCAWSIVVAYYAALVMAIGGTRIGRPAAWASLLLGAVIVIGPHAAARDGVSRPASGILRVVFLDVGQGDATLIVLPNQRAMLVDAGGLPMAPFPDQQDGPAFDVGERVVGRALRALGVRALDTLVLTHADPDHIGGARALMRGFAPGAIWEGVPVPPHPGRRALRDLSRAHGIGWHRVATGYRLESGEVEIAVLHPPPPDWERQRVRNDDSVVLAVRYGRVSVIVPGDIGREGERAALTHVEPAPIAILKAPHHGSATSSTPEFLARIRPAAVIFSAGRRNPFGHPVPAVVSRYRALGAAMFSTAEDGAVILDTDGQTVELRGWTGRVHRIEDVH